MSKYVLYHNMLKCSNGEKSSFVVLYSVSLLYDSRETEYDNITYDNRETEYSIQ